MQFELNDKVLLSLQLDLSLGNFPVNFHCIARNTWTSRLSQQTANYAGYETVNQLIQVIAQ